MHTRSFKIHSAHWPVIILIISIVYSGCSGKQETEPDLKPELPVETVLLFSKTSGDYFRGIAFADSLNGLAVGVGGADMYYRTTDGGASWKFEALPANLLPSGNFFHGIYAIHFEKPDMGFICGKIGNSAQGYIAKSTDKGFTWNIKINYVSSAPWQIEFDGQYGLAIGNNSMIVRSDDGGETWTTLSGLPNNVANLTRVHMNDPDHYYVSGPHTLWKSTDKGLSWQNIPVPSQGGGPIIWGGNYQMSSATTGYVSGSNGISKTIDAGLNWQNIITTAQFHLGDHFLMGENGLSFENVAAGEFWISADGGNSFKQYRLPSNPNQEIDISLYGIWNEYAVHGDYIYCWPENAYTSSVQCLYRIKYK